jgi:hypothetical protein
MFSNNFGKANFKLWRLGPTSVNVTPHEDSQVFKALILQPQIQTMFEIPPSLENHKPYTQ